ncbi:MAG: response regulator [Fibromonadales bacterium]|nr:response regulator [Fibromonadales bacterium]
MPLYVWVPLLTFIVFAPALILGPKYLISVLLAGSFASISILFVNAKSKQKVTEQKLEESNKSLSILTSILGSSDALIYVTVPTTGEILFINERAKERYSIKGNCIGQLCYKVLQNGIDQMCEFCPCRKLDNNPKGIIIWEERNNLTKRIYRNVDRYIEWYNGKTAHIQYSTDITDLVSSKELIEQNNRNKNLFLSRMSYEIRSPMNVILGTSETQQHDQTSDFKVRDAFAMINNSAHLLFNTINSTLDLFKMESGEMELIITKYKVSELLSDSLQLNLKQLENKSIELELDIDENIPLKLIGDEIHIKQILNNLLFNTFKNIENGLVKLSVFAEKAEDIDVTLVFSVSAETDAFVDDADLAMSIIKNLVNLMHGELTVKNEPEKISVCTVRLPQKIISSDVLGKKLAENLMELTGKSFAKEYMPYGSVLIVDDVESNLYVVKELMSPYGLSIDTVSSGFDAIDRIKSGRVYDIVFMDHMMPKMDGIETVKIIRKELKYTGPIVALTANIMTGQAKIFFDNGFDDFISKPINSRQLDSVLNKLIRNKQTPKVIADARQQKKDAMKMYKKSDEYLAVFAKDAKKALFEIEQTFKNISDASNDDLQMFAVNSHSMKSLLADIGENTLSQMAFALEEAGKQRDKNTIAKKTQQFVSEVEAIVSNIEAKLVEKNSYIL